MNATGIGAGEVAVLTVILTATGTGSSLSLPVSSVMGVLSDGTAATATGTGGTITVTQPPPTVTTMACAPASVMSGGTSSCTVTLSNAAPAGGAAVALSSNNGALTVPASVTVAAGATTGTFTGSAGSVTANQTATVTASLNGGSATAGVTVTPAPPTVTALACAPASLWSGGTSSCTVTLAKAALPGGAVVALSSNNAALTVPASVTVAAGATTGSFTASSAWVTSNQTATVTASLNGSTTTASVTVTTSVISGVQCAPASVASGGTSSCTVTMSPAAPAGGCTVTLSSNNTALTVPASVTVAAGATTGSFTAAAGSVTVNQVATVGASYNGSTGSTAVTVTPVSSTVTALVCAPASVISGGTSACTVTLANTAPAGGAVVTISSNSTALTVPASVTVAAGATTGSFTAAAGSVTVNQVATVGASYNGSTGSTAVTVTPVPSTVTALVCAPASVVSGGTSTCTVTLANTAPAGGAVVALSSNNTALTVAVSVTVAAGATTGSFTATGGSATTSQPVTVAASLNGTSATATVTVTASSNCPCTIWSPTSTPGTADAGDASAVELGFRFRSDVNGFVTAVRFYKSAANTGTHFGNLWSDSGALLASATFTGESSSGWQQVNFTAPVAVAAGTTYIASYYAPAGHYSFNANFFTPNGIDTPPLHALADGTAGSSGVFAYGSSSAFPNGTYKSANYWVDVVFTTVAPPPPAAVTVSKVACSPTSIVAGSSAACTVTLSSPAPGGGSVVTLSDNSAALTTPASLTVAAGATSGSFSATAGSVTADQPVTVTASLNGSSASSALTVVAAPVSTGLVAAYSFNEGTGTTVADASGNGNTGTISNAKWSTAGKFGNALKFNGSSSWVTINDSASLDLTKGMTLEGWINPTALGTAWRTLVLKEQPNGLVYSLYANTDTSQPSGHVYITTEYNTRGTAAAPLNTWTHLATTYDGATLRMYVNGVLASSKAVTGSIKASAGVLRIGGNSVWGEYFTGLIDEVRIYNRALAASEIVSDMNNAVKSLSKTVTALSLTASGAPPSNAAHALSLRCMPSRVVAGGQAVCELRLPAGSDASEIQVSSSSGALRAPRRVQSRAKESRLTFQLSVDASAAGQAVTLTAASGNVLAQETVLVAPAAAPLLQVPGKQFARFGNTLRFDVSAGETSGLPVQLMAADLPTGASFDAASGRFEWTPTESQQGSRVVSFAATAGGQSATARVTIDVDSGSPVLDQSAAFACSPGAIGSLQGKWLSGSAHGSTDLSGEAFSLEGTGVRVNGEFTPVIEVSISRVQFVCPALPAGTPLSLVVTTGAAKTGARHSVMQAASPAIFSLNGSGRDQGVVSFARADELATARDSRMAGRPAQAGDEILIWGTGFGSMEARSLRVEVGGAAAEVESVNAVPGQAGVYTIRARVAAAATPDATAPVHVFVYSPDGRQFESNTVTVALEAAAR